MRAYFSISQSLFIAAFRSAVVKEKVLWSSEPRVETLSPDVAVKLQSSKTSEEWMLEGVLIAWEIQMDSLEGCKDAVSVLRGICFLFTPSRTALGLDFFTLKIWIEPFPYLFLRKDMFRYLAFDRFQGTKMDTEGRKVQKMTAHIIQLHVVDTKAVIRKCHFLQHARNGISNF